MYEKNKMREYIKNSELRVFSSAIKVRLSKELSIKYDNGSYNEYLNNMSKCLEMINTLGIKYPANAHPILYVYIVPDENYGELLNIPKKFDNGKGGGKPVMCYDLDGFSWAYGLSQNMLENKELKEIGISKIENEIHELSHIVHSQFFSKDLIISEGFAEALPLYALNLEEVFTEHKIILLFLSRFPSTTLRMPLLLSAITDLLLLSTLNFSPLLITNFEKFTLTLSSLIPSSNSKA